MRKKGGFTLLEVLVVLAVIGILAAILLPILGLTSGHSPGSIFSKIFVVMKYNIGFWVLIVVAAGFGLYRKITHPKDFIWLELPIQFAASTLMIFLLYLLFFSTSSNMQDTEIWNSYVQRAEYYEEWTSLESRQVCNSYDKDGNCSSWRTEYYHQYHSPSWGLITSTNETLGISPAEYRNYVVQFGREEKKYLHRARQISHGDGNMFLAVFDGSRLKMVPAAIEHTYMNYLKASQSIKKRSGSVEIYKKFIKPYPRSYRGKYGHTELDRVILASGITPEMREWAQNTDKELDRVIAILGPQKEANALVYLVGSSDQGFLHALEEHWVHGKKNDIVVIIGSAEFPKIDWVSVMSWTEAEYFKINLRDRVADLKVLSAANSEELARIIGQEISKPAEQGGFKRKKMRDLEYLVSDIKLPWWSQLIIVIVSGAGSWGASHLLIKTDFRRM